MATYLSNVLIFFLLMCNDFSAVLKCIVLFSCTPLGSFSEMFSMQLVLSFKPLGSSQNEAAAHVSNAMVLQGLCFPLPTFFLSVKFLECNLLLIWFFFKRFLQTSFLFIVFCLFSFCFSVHIQFILSLL